MKLAVLGAGSWGLALAELLSSADLEVSLWFRRPELAEEVSRTRVHPLYLPELHLSAGVRVTGALEEACAGAETVIFAAPTHGQRAVAERAGPLVRDASLLISAAKGFEAESALTMTELLAQVLGEDSRERLVALSGPNIAAEVAARMPTAAVVAATSPLARKLAVERLAAPSWRLYANDDPQGVEFAGAMKNVIAIAAGVCDGLQVGDNAKAAIITRGLSEMTRLGVRAGANPFTFAGLAGVGDCLVTCISRLSRNRTLGERIGRGEGPESAQAETPMVAEGVNASRAALILARRFGVEIPITQAVHAILFEGTSVSAAVQGLMDRNLRPELVPEDIGLARQPGDA
ncbi:MAG TPA: NAD(P)H-dependent glycerol-3-phosphate dehydrogenase [Candidatus Dormibacteraeota bacterium]|nr:NAD(P)H-dependent glycerol-3-phosphate dehydrogenase [Candidatus Dormibacteraeota bacterium]